MLFRSIAAEAKTFSRLVDLPVFSLYSGSAEGSGTITGTLADPVINAEFIGKDMTVGVPDYVDEKMTCADFRVKTTDSVFSAVDSLFIDEKSGARIKSMDAWPPPPDSQLVAVRARPGWRPGCAVGLLEAGVREGDGGVSADAGTGLLVGGESTAPSEPH